MRPNTERLMNDISTLEAFLTGEARIDSNNLMPIVCSFGTEDRKERAPTSIQNAFRQVMVLDHIRDDQVFKERLFHPHS